LCVCVCVCVCVVEFVGDLAGSVVNLGQYHSDRASDPGHR